MTINLSKGQTISLAKPSTNAGLTRIRLGLGWDAAAVEHKRLFGRTKRVQRDIDLDASALLIGSGVVEDLVYFGQLSSQCGSVQHTGDNRTGDGDGDDESIVVDLTLLPAQIEHIVFTVNSFTGERFTEIENAFVRVVDSADQDAEIARYTLTGSGEHTALVMARISRRGSAWEFTAIGSPGEGRTARELGPLALGLVT